MLARWLDIDKLKLIGVTLASYWKTIIRPMPAVKMQVFWTGCNSLSKKLRG